MLQIRCTAKVLKQFGVTDSGTGEPVSEDSLLGNWYCNLLTIDRRKCMLFMSERTFLSFLLYGIRKDNSNSIAQVFANGLSQLLEIEKFNDKQIERVFSDYQLCELTKTNNRSTLGNLRDLMLNYEHSIMHQGGLKQCNLGKIIYNMNRMPQKNLDWKFSIDVARELINSNTAP